MKPTKKIWSKLTPEQKNTWKRLYKVFLADLRSDSPAKLEVIAHNHALLAVWEMHGGLGDV